MTFLQELASLNPFNWSKHEVQSSLEVGTQAPSTPQISLPRHDQKPVIIAFLRHCGCPFAEKILLKLREAADQNPSICFIAVSHSDKPSTEKWLHDVGGTGNVEVLVDDERKSFSTYGLGLSSFWAVLNPSSLRNAMFMGKEEGINIRPTQSGSRWQQAGLFAADGAGVITYAHTAESSDDLGDLDAALKSVNKASGST